MNKIGVTFTPHKPKANVLKCSHLANSIFNNRYNDFFYDGYKHTKGDYNISAFTTEYKDVSLVFPNNIFVPISVNDKIKGLHESLNGIDTMDEEEGVYLIETYSITNNTTTNINNVIRMYSEYRNRNAPGCKLWGEIISSVTDKNNFAIPLTIKIVHFIPMSIIDRDVYTYIPGVNVCIAPTRHTDRALHPSSKSSNMMDSICDMLGLGISNAIDIDIVDNENPNKEYFLRIGNIVNKIISKTSEVSNSRMKISVKLNDNIKSIVEEGKDKFEESGLYDSYEKAMTLGDVSVANESKRLDNERAKIDLEKFKINSELRTLTIKENIAAFTGKVDIYKRVLELESAKIKFKGDVYKGELEKYKLENSINLSRKNNNLNYARDVIKLSGIIPII